MEVLQCKEIPHLILFSDPAIAKFYRSEKINDQLRTREASSDEEAVEALTDIRRSIPPRTGKWC
jgi:hypothetical protein